MNGQASGVPGSSYIKGFGYKNDMDIKFCNLSVKIYGDYHYGKKQGVFKGHVFNCKLLKTVSRLRRRSEWV